MAFFDIFLETILSYFLLEFAQKNREGKIPSRLCPKRNTHVCLLPESGSRPEPTIPATRPEQKTQNTMHVPKTNTYGINVQLVICSQSLGKMVQFQTQTAP